MIGHVDKWCLENCDPRKFKELDQVRINMQLPSIYRSVLTFHYVG